MKFIVIFSEKLHQKKRKLTKHPLLRSVDHIINLSMHFFKKWSRLMELFGKSEIYMAFNEPLSSRVFVLY